MIWKPLSEYGRWWLIGIILPVFFMCIWDKSVNVISYRSPEKNIFCGVAFNRITPISFNSKTPLRSILTICYPDYYIWFRLYKRDLSFTGWLEVTKENIILLRDTELKCGRYLHLFATNRLLIIIHFTTSSGPSSLWKSFERSQVRTI